MHSAFLVQIVQRGYICAISNFTRTIQGSVNWTVNGRRIIGAIGWCDYGYSLSAGKKGTEFPLCCSSIFGWNSKEHCCPCTVLSACAGTGKHAFSQSFCKYVLYMYCIRIRETTFWSLICGEYLLFAALHCLLENVLFLTKGYGLPCWTPWITAHLLNPFCSSISPQMFCTDLALGRCLSRLPAFMCSLQGSRANRLTRPETHFLFCGPRGPWALRSHSTHYGEG